MRVLAYCKWLTTSCRRYNLSKRVHTVSPQRGRHIGNNHSACSREIALWDTSCRLERQYIEDITRWREDMNFIFELQNILRTSAASE